MTIKDSVGLELNADADSDGNRETGLFEFEAGVQIQRQMRTSFVLDATGDRVAGAIQGGFLGDGSGAPRRSGITLDTGGGRLEYRISFREPSGGDNPFGSVDGVKQSTDASGESARRKANVLMRYLTVGTYDSNAPAKLFLGEYESRDNTDGAYEDFIPVAIDDVDLTVTAEEEAILEGQLTLRRVGTLGAISNDGRRDR